ncbi:MAG: hypothetical protein ACKOWC_01795 [Limnohabitans sp.]
MHTRWLRALATAMLLVLMAPCFAEVAIGILDVKADGSAYLYTRRKLDSTTSVTLDASLEHRCCWNGSGADFRLLNAQEIEAARDKRPFASVDLEEGMRVYELRNSNYTWRDNLSIAIIDSDRIVRLNYPKTIRQRLGAVKGGQKYVVTLFPGREGLNLTLHGDKKKKLDHLYYSQGGM